MTVLIGILLAVLGILGGQWLEGGQIASLFQLTALLIVVAGTLGAVLIQTPAVVLRQTFAMLPWLLRPPQHQGATVIERVVGWSIVARREGLLALETRIDDQHDAYVRTGLQMLVDGFEADDLRGALEVQLCTVEEQLKSGARVFEVAGGYAPTIGILGAVLGLIHVMESLGDPARLGAGIAVAFVSTIYGVGFANLVLLPLAGRLRSLAHQRVVEMEMLLDGLAGIAAGENPGVISMRLRAYLATP